MYMARLHARFNIFKLKLFAYKYRVKDLFGYFYFEQVYLWENKTVTSKSLTPPP